MDELVKRALKVHDALRDCVASEVVDDCVKCVYYGLGYGCYNALMLDAAEVIGRLIEEVGND